MKEEFLGIERFKKTGLEQGECFERRERHGSSVCWRCFCIEGIAASGKNQQEVLGRAS